MTGQPTVSFAALLRQLRVDAGLTQEELAAAAQVSARSVSDLERGVNVTARRETARLLGGALRLDGPARMLFEAAARGRIVANDAPVLVQSATSVAAARTLPRDAVRFTGREPELRRVLAMAADAGPGGEVVGICAIGGMAGVGKTALAVRWAHQVPASARCSPGPTGSSAPKPRACSASWACTPAPTSPSRRPPASPQH